MSFKELAEASVIRRSAPVVIKLKDGKELNFTANEISFLQRVEIGLNSDNMHVKLITMSIKDEQGNYMTAEQAHMLSNEHQEVFYRAALDVNSIDDTSKKKAK